MPYFVYVKRTAPEHWNSQRREFIPQDTQFRAINDKGVRVSKLEQAMMFESKEEASEWMQSKIDKRGLVDGVVWEVRKKS